jgi:low temperature requirement protein LtrA
VSDLDATHRPPPQGRFRLAPMRPRDPAEQGRTASTLELFFDLVFVVAVSIASAQLHHALTAGHVLDGVLDYAIVFFGIWWAWMNFTWFATSFDTDDWLYRLLTIVQMGGVLALAAGIPSVFEHSDFTVLVIAYVVMRLAMVAQWLRAARGTGPAATAARAYAIGITTVQALWFGSLLLPHAVLGAAQVLLILGELAVPVLAEHVGRTTWHPHHITERYGLFTLILLGESLLGSTNAIIEALHRTTELAPLVGVAALALVATAAQWWIYFWPPHHRVVQTFTSSLLYGYGHYFVFAAAGAFSAGIEVEIDVLSDHGALHPPLASLTYTIPLTVFILGIRTLAIRPHADRWVNTCVPAAALLVLVDPLLPAPFALTAIILAATVAVLIRRRPIQES